MNGMKKEVILIVVATSILVLTLSFLSKKQEIKEPTTLKIGSVTLNIGVANTDAERMQGLSGRSGLQENEGLLFIFEQQGYYGFWMKDMKFPIDIAWLDKNKKIIHIESNILPDTYPEVFSPTSPALYVLEASANFFENHQIKIGDVAEF
jgi:uncharacterized protein